MPVDNGRLSISFSLRFSPGLNSGVPPPRMTGLTPEFVDQPVRDEACRQIGAAEQKDVFCALALQPCHRAGDIGAEHLRVVPVDRVSVRENTYFGAAFMKSAISPDAVEK